jgi:hypothetical protein
MYAKLYSQRSTMKPVMEEFPGMGWVEIRGRILQISSTNIKSAILRLFI